jgi:hypothetical protein
MVVEPQRTVTCRFSAETKTKIDKMIPDGGSLSSTVRDIVEEYFRIKETVVETPQPSPPSPLTDMTDFNKVITALKKVDDAFAPEKLSLSGCIALYEFFRAARYGSGPLLNGLLNNDK